MKQESKKPIDSNPYIHFIIIWIHFRLSVLKSLLKFNVRNN